MPHQDVLEQTSQKYSRHLQSEFWEDKEQPTNETDTTVADEDNSHVIAHAGHVVT